MPAYNLDVDCLITRLLYAGVAGNGTPAKMTAVEIRCLCMKARELFLQNPTLLELVPPVKICGDIFGHFDVLMRIFATGGFPPDANYLFLGDYVDRGKQSLETICLLLALKVKYPQNIFLLRGNHEDANINSRYGFYDECKRRFNVKLWKTFTDCFNCLPIAAVVGEKIFCCHGGLSPDLQNVYYDIYQIPRPTEIPYHGLLCDLLWSDPDPVLRGWNDNDRGISYTFGRDVLKIFLKDHNFDLVVRGHQDGYQFFGKRRLVTLFSVPNFCDHFENAGAIMSVDEDLTCGFQILLPRQSLGANIDQLEPERNINVVGGIAGRANNPEAMQE